MITFPPRPSRPPVSAAALLTATLLSLAASLSLMAQTAPAPDADPAPADPVMELPPFTVTSEQESGYLAGNAISGTKTNTALRDLPISISVITSDMLADLNAVMPSDALFYSASVDFSQNGTGTTPVQGSPFNTGTTFVRGSGTFFNMRDGFRTYSEPAGVGVQRVEIVKGPSSVLYGITKPGGIVNYITKVPVTGRTFGRASLSYGSYSTRRASLDYNLGGLLDGKLALRLNASYADVATWYTSSRSTEKVLMPSVSYQPFKDTNVMFQYEYTNRVFPPNSTSFLARTVTGYRGSSVPYFIYPTGSTDPVATLTPQLPAGLTPDYTFRGHASETRVPYRTGILTLTQGFGEHLKVNAQFARTYRNNWRSDFDVTAQFTGSLTDANAANTVLPAPRLRRQYENRDATNQIDNANLTAIYSRRFDLPVLGKGDHKFILGYTNMVDSFREWRVRQFRTGTTNRLSYYYAFAPDAFTGAPAGFPDARSTHYLGTTPVTFSGVPGEFRRDATQDVAEENKFETYYAAWSGNLFSDRLVLNAGVVRAEASQDRYAGAAATYTRADYEQDSPLVGAIVRPIEWVSLYVQASKSFNPNTSARDGFGTPLPAETGKGVEFGVKLDPWDGRLTANLAAYETVEQNRFITDPNAPNQNSFYIDANGQQQPISGPNDPRYDPNLPGQNKGAGAAVGEATTKGVDVELIWSPFKQLQIFATYSFVDGVVTRDVNNTLATLQGRPLPNNYDHRATVLAKYRFTEGALKGFDVVLGANWRSEMFKDIVNATDNSTTAIISPVERFSKPVWDGDFKLGYATSVFGRKTSFQLNAKNIFGRTLGTGWQPTTERTYAFEQYYYEVPTSYTFSVSFDL